MRNNAWDAENPAPHGQVRRKLGISTAGVFLCCPWEQQPERLYNKEPSNMMQRSSALTLSRQVSRATYHIKNGKGAFAYQCFRAKELRSIFLKMYLLLSVWVCCLHLCIWITWIQSPQRPEENIKSSWNQRHGGGGVRNGSSDLGDTYQQQWEKFCVFIEQPPPLGGSGIF